jgi:hypothetical protein
MAAVRQLLKHEGSRLGNQSTRKRRLDRRTHVLSDMWAKGFCCHIYGSGIQDLEHSVYRPVADQKRGLRAVQTVIVAIYAFVILIQN